MRATRNRVGKGRQEVHNHSTLLGDIFTASAPSFAYLSLAAGYHEVSRVLPFVNPDSTLFAASCCIVCRFKLKPSIELWPSNLARFVSGLNCRNLASTPTPSTISARI